MNVITLDALDSFREVQKIRKELAKIEQRLGHKVARLSPEDLRDYSDTVEKILKEE